MTTGTGGVLSIGALSAATGIPAETIRTWERRYGFPVAARKPSGHRVYPVSTVPRLRLIGQILARGHRAADVVPASERELEALYAAQPLPGAEPRAGARTRGAAAEPPGDLFAAVEAFDAERLRRAFQTDWARHGPLEFVEQCAAPFLRAIGDAWARRDLDVRHEHFASACLGDFLRTVRGPLDERARGPLVVLATLPGERHGLALQMCALVFALAGWRALVLGVDTPVEQIAALQKEMPIAAVAISCVMPQHASNAKAVRALRRRLPRRVPLFVGGPGASPRLQGNGIEVMADLNALDHWLQTRAIKS